MDLTELKMVIDEAKALARAHAEEALKSMVTGDIRFVLLRGSTPSWNDGDSCRHSQDTVVNGWDAWAKSYWTVEIDEDGDIEVISEGGCCRAPFDWREGEQQPSQLLAKKLEDAASAFEAAWGTDWVVAVWRDEAGEIQFRKSAWYSE